MNNFFKKNIQNFELKIGTHATQIIGTIFFLIGSLFFLKYAIENGFISPWCKVILGVIIATIIIGITKKISSTMYYFSIFVTLGIATILCALFLTSYFELTKTVQFFVNTKLFLITFWSSDFYFLISLAILSIILGIIGYIYRNDVIRYISYTVSLPLTIYFIHGIFKHIKSFDPIHLACLLTTILISNQIIFLLEKFLHHNYLNSIEKKYIKCGFEKTSAFALMAAGYNVIDILRQNAQMWENAKLAAYFSSIEAFYLNLSGLYIVLALIFIFIRLEIASSFLFVASGYCFISFLNHSAATWQNTYLASLFISQNAFHLWITIFYGLSALICILIGLTRKLFTLRLVGFYLILLTIWKLFFIIKDIQETEYKILAFMSIGIALGLISFIYKKLSHSTK